MLLQEHTWYFMVITESNIPLISCPCHIQNDMLLSERTMYVLVVAFIMVFSLEMVLFGLVYGVYRSIQLYHRGQFYNFYSWRKLEYPVRSTDLVTKGLEDIIQV
jgi:hypothetical protein